MRLEQTVAVVTMGGTIACILDPRGGVTPSPKADFMASVLEEAVRSGAGLPQPRLVRAPAVASAALDAPTLATLIEQFERLVDDGACGVVVTVGTDALEEVAFLFDLLWHRDEPIVVLGAMRHGELPGSDGPANLRDGLRVAADDGARGMGCLVVMNGQVHQAWQVRKGHTGQLSAFESSVSGPVGSVQEDTVRMSTGSVIDRPLFKLGPATSIPPIALIKAALGDDGRALSAARDMGYGGLVLETMGGGSVPPAWAPALERIASTMPVVYASRTFAGPTLRATYGGLGSELHLQDIGLIPAGLLDGLKARLLLGLLVASNADPTTMNKAWEMFDIPTSNGRRLELTTTD